MNQENFSLVFEFIGIRKLYFFPMYDQDELFICCIWQFSTFALHTCMLVFCSTVTWVNTNALKIKEYNSM